VKGKVIDVWGGPVANLTLDVGKTETSTDAKGAFTVANVPVPYDVSLSTDSGSWIFQGLTRPDPTLQVLASPLSQSTDISIPLTKIAVGASDTLSIANGTATGSVESDGVTPDPTFPFDSFPSWDGATTTASTFHLLEWTIDAKSLPTAYKGYVAVPLSLTANVDGSLPAPTLAAVTSKAAVTGSAVQNPLDAALSRTNSVFVQFTSGAHIQVVEDQAGPATFSYLAPTLTNSTITVAAWEGTEEGPLGLIHKDGLKPGDATGALTIPGPPKPKTLLDPDHVDENTTLSFAAGTGNAGAFVVGIELDGGNVLRVVTTKKSIVIKDLIGSVFTLAHAAPGDTPIQYYWWVETHGSYATVDAMAGTSGYIDEFGVNFITPVSIHQTDGSYTSSALFGFTTKNQ
jgi:hypothetical protein